MSLIPGASGSQVQMPDGCLQLSAYSGTTPQPGGSSPFQLVSSNNRIQLINPATNIIIKLPSSGIVAGEEWRIANTSTLYTITVQTYNGTATIFTIQPKTEGHFIASVATPINAGDWDTKQIDHSTSILSNAQLISSDQNAQGAKSSYSFTGGVVNYILLPTLAAFTSTDDYTILFRFRQPSAAAGYLFNIVGAVNTLLITTQVSGSIGIIRHVLGSNTTDTTSVNVCDGNWHTVAIKRYNSGTSLDIFIDGVKNVSAASIIASATGISTVFSLGSSTAGNNATHQMDRAIVLRSALSDAAVVRLSNGSKIDIEQASNIALDLEPDNITNSIWIDASQNGLHGQVTGALVNRFTPQYSCRNLIINGAQDINQRYGTTLTSLTQPYGIYVTDRFGIYNSAPGTMALNTQTVTDAPLGFSNSLKITSTSSFSLVGNLWLYQVIEGNNIVQLFPGTAAAKTITLSFWCKVTAPTATYPLTQSVTFTNKNADSYTTEIKIAASGVWQYNTITLQLPTDPAHADHWFLNSGAGLQLLFGFRSSLATSNLNTWQIAANLLVSTNQSNILGEASGNSFQITGIMLNEGSVAAPFERAGGSYQQEFALCQRYCQNLAGSNAISLRMVNYNATSMAFNSFIFPVLMRGTPVLFNTLADGTDIIVYTSGNVAQSGGSWGLTNASTAGVQFAWTKSSHGLTDGYVQTQNTGKVIVSAEL